MGARQQLNTACLLAFLSLAALPAAAQGGGTALRLGQPNAAQFPEVTLYAYPTDARGAFISGAERSFQVAENGRPAQVLRVETTGGTLDVCLALDRSPSMLDEDKLDYAKAAAREFIDQLAPGDRAALITFAEGSQLEQPLTDDRRLLQTAVTRTQVSGTTTTFLDGVYWSVNQVALRPQASVLGAGQGRAEARRVVVALTDGNDLSSRVTTQQLLAYARANGVSICTVALGKDASRTSLQYLAEQTGGVYLQAPAPSDLKRLYTMLADQLRHEYRVTIRSPHPQADGKRRDVHVALAGEPLTGDTWYQAPGQGSLLVTAPAAIGSGSALTGVAATSTELARNVLAMALMVLGVVVVGGAVFFWLRRRPQPGLPIREANPRIDLLPLWVTEGSTRVGRGAECELVLDSHQVSRVHARIEAVNGIFRIIDEGSRNGTYVNGRKVRGAQELEVGDVVRFGDREFRFAGALSS